MGGLSPPVFYVVKKSKVVTFSEPPWGALALQCDITDSVTTADFLTFMNANTLSSSYPNTIEVASIS